MAETPSQPSELVFLPRPSWMPALIAAGIAFVIVGLFVWWPYAAIGGAVALLALISWIRRASRENSELPIEQHPATAVLPAATPRRTSS